MSAPRPLSQQTIRYLLPLGVIGSDAAIAAGDLGRYLGPAPDDGWYLTEPAAHPGKIAPVTLDMIEVAG